jgi:uncharacterized protein YecE (DUF72 family)
MFAAKVPQVVTHEKVLKDPEAELDEFIDRMNLLHEKLGPMLLQFPKFDKYEIHPDKFSRRLDLVSENILGSRLGNHQVESAIQPRSLLLGVPAWPSYHSHFVQTV